MLCLERTLTFFLHECMRGEGIEEGLSTVSEDSHITQHSQCRNDTQTPDMSQFWMTLLVTLD